MSAVKTSAGGGADLQSPFDAAVVIPTTLRPALSSAVGSVFAQEGVERVQVLVGVDAHDGDPDLPHMLAKAAPTGRVLTVVDPGYSTNKRHGGVYGAYDGGALRSVLTLLANSRHVAYLDDDNTWEPDHLRSLLDAIGDDAWAYANRVFVNPVTGAVVCEDEWESTGPDSGIYGPEFGGFVDPNCLLIDKIKAFETIGEWTRPLEGYRRGDTADRRVFDVLRELSKGRPTGRASVRYTLPATDPDAKERMALIRKWEARLERGV